MNRIKILLLVILLGLLPYPVFASIEHPTQLIATNATSASYVDNNLATHPNLPSGDITAYLNYTDFPGSKLEYNVTVALYFNKSNNFVPDILLYNYNTAAYEVVASYTGSVANTEFWFNYTVKDAKYFPLKVASTDYHFSAALLSNISEIQAWATNATVLNLTMNQGTGNYVNDSSGWNNNGTLSVNPPTWTTNFNNGSINITALEFNGLGNNEVVIPTNASLNVTNAITVSQWIKMNNSDADSFTLRKGNSKYAIFFNANTVIPTVITNGVNRGNFGSISLNTWSYLAFTYSNDGTANNFRLYKNGVLVSSSTVIGDITTDGLSLIVGSGNGAFYFNGTIDETKVYNFALNQSEITAEYQRFQPVPAYPVANSNISVSAAAKNVNFTWHDTLYSSDELIVATDSAFTAIVHDAFYSSDYANISLTSNTTYYWRIRQFNSGTGSYGNTSETQKFTLGVFTGYINVLVVDELSFARVDRYNATLYSEGYSVSKTTTTGVVNFSHAEAPPGQYTLVITPNTTYAERAIIVNSPLNVTVYIPNTARTVDFVSFYLLDYTGRFSFSVSNLTITKGVNTTHSQYFDSDAKVAANLIRGEVYTITVFNPLTDSMQQWGSYSSTGTGGVQVVIMDLGVNQSILQPYVQRINASNDSIAVSWLDRSAVLNWVNISIYKDNTSTPVYNLNTTVGTGTASYTITDLNATYIIQVNASTTQGFKVDTLIYSPRAKAIGLITTWRYGSFTMPAWVKSAFAIIVMFMLAGSFGAMHRGEGAVITAFMGVFFWWYDILSLQGAAGALFGGFVLYAVLYHLESKRRQGIL